jgi:glycosyltransferase involved in cell wall biosynthesis
VFSNAESIIKISVIILTHHRLDLLRDCLRSLTNQKSHPFRLEILVLINGADVDSVQYLKEESLKNSVLNVSFNNKPKKVGDARNQLIQKASGDFICFIDDDIELPKDYFQKAATYLKQFPDIDGFGGPDQTKDNASDFQEILGEVMKTFFAMGPTAKRHKSKQTKVQRGNEINLILCNLWIKRSIFKEGHSFPASYIRNEENILLAQLDKAGKIFMYFEDLIVFHERKASLQKLIKTTYLSGVYRTIGFFDEKRTIRWYFFVPQIILLTGAYFAIVDIIVFIYLIIAYLFLNLAHSFYIVLRLKRITKLYVAMTLYLVYNFIYTTGMFVGYFKKIKMYVKK